MTRNWFDAGGEAYARYRPDYPLTLASHLVACAPGRRLAVDVGCGNGQFTRQLAGEFEQVIGLDPSADQIAHAVPHDRIRYRVASAEALRLETGSVDLVTAAQAAHWFDLPRFYAEVRRVAAPGAVLALVSYGPARFDAGADAEIDACLQRFHTAGIGRWWPPERHLVDTGYADIEFPFRPLPARALDIVRRWSAEALLGYVSTWSAMRRAREAGEVGRLEGFAKELVALWGDPATERTIRWPVTVRLGVVE